MNKILDWLGRHAIVAAGVVLIVGVAAFSIFWHDDLALLFSAIAVLVTFLALVAASVAVQITWPQYEKFLAEQARAPCIHLRAELAEDEQSLPRRIGDESPEFHGISFVLRVVVENRGNASMRDGTVNIVALPNCVITPIDPDAKTHYESPLPTTNAEITDDGTEVPVRFSVARENFTPGDHVFHATIKPMPPDEVGQWPIFVDLTGDPLPEPKERRQWKRKFHRIE